MFEAGGSYRRPSCFPREGESAAQAIAREALACRTAVAMYDGSPLGKFELHGPDVPVFLDRVYANRWNDVAVGRGRFGWMLRDDGRLLDDGITFRLGEDRWWMFAGSGAADHVHKHLGRLLQLEWPDLKVYLTTVTAQWTNVCVSGPKSRAMLEAAGTGASLAADAFPFMTVREMTVAGIPARVARAGYTGELSFESNVPARHGERLWESLVSAGAPAHAPQVIGYVSQACHSPNVGRSIALAVLDDGRRRIDERIEMAAIDRRAPALVSRPCFVDPAGERMRG